MEPSYPTVVDETVGSASVVSCKNPHCTKQTRHTSDIQAARHLPPPGCRINSEPERSFSPGTQALAPALPLTMEAPPYQPVPPVPQHHHDQVSSDRAEYSRDWTSGACGETFQWPGASIAPEHGTMKIPMIIDCDSASRKSNAKRHRNMFASRRWRRRRKEEERKRGLNKMDISRLINNDQNNPQQKSGIYQAARAIPKDGVYDHMILPHHPYPDPPVTIDPPPTPTTCVNTASVVVRKTPMTSNKQKQL